MTASIDVTVVFNVQLVAGQEQNTDAIISDLEGRIESSMYHVVVWADDPASPGDYDVEILALAKTNGIPRHHGLARDAVARRTLKQERDRRVLECLKKELNNGSL